MGALPHSVHLPPVVIGVAKYAAPVSLSIEALSQPLSPGPLPRVYLLATRRHHPAFPLCD